MSAERTSPSGRLAAWRGLARLRTSERGAELVEFALALPLLMVVFGGIIDFGLMLQRHQVLSNAAREGARLAILPNYSCETDVVPRVTAYVREGISDPAATPATTCPTVTITPGTGPAFEAVQVTVTLTEPFLVLGPIVNLAGGNWTLGSNITLQATSTMRTETVSGS
jgi:Flp pilus assembly protein TadG